MIDNLNYDSPDKNSKCYDEKDYNCNTHGRLYSWQTATLDSICPSEWRVPTKQDFLILLEQIGVDTTTLIGRQKGSLGENLKAPSSWTKNNSTNEFNFSALASGWHQDNNGYNNLGTKATFWTSSSNTISLKWSLIIENNGDVNLLENIYNFHFSIRCIKN
jgi:uncharacterized protein (TIGR02145 family)